MRDVNLRGLGGLRGHLRRVAVGGSYIPQDLAVFAVFLWDLHAYKMGYFPAFLYLPSSERRN